ncbi:hypothetical protein PC121_g9114 [Phytophthora cactorum]|nr:hypothetical protein PC120_g14590 [Phytophthora cactorum]KAG3071900.1 hypothetical protein PC121_g9114 [Phytophthora cactorum]
MELQSEVAALESVKREGQQVTTQSLVPLIHDAGPAPALETVAQSQNRLDSDSVMMEAAEASRANEQIVSEVADRPMRRKEKKRKAARPIEPSIAKKLEKAVVVRLRKRAETTATNALGESVWLALNAAIALEERPDRYPDGELLRSFMLSVPDAGRAIIKDCGRHPDQSERHLEDMRLLVSVAVVNLECELSRGQVPMALTMLDVLQALHDTYPEQTKTLYQNCLQLRKCVVTTCNEPELANYLHQKLEDLPQWRIDDDYTKKEFP